MNANFKARLQSPLQSVGGKLFLLLFVTTAGLTAALGWVSYTVAKGLIIDQVAGASSQTIVQAADKLDFLFAQYESLSRQLLVDQELKEDLQLVSRPDADYGLKSQAENRIRRKLDAIVSSDRRLLRVMLIPRTLDIAQTYRTSGSSSILINEANAGTLKAIIEADGDIRWLPVQKKGLYTLNAEPTLTMGRLLKNAQRPEAEYILTLEIKSQALTDILSNVRLGQTGEISLVTGDGKVVYAAETAALEQVSDILGRRGDQEEGAFNSREEDGVERLVVHKRLQTAKWQLAGRTPVSDFVQDTDKLLTITVAMTLLAIVLAAAVGYIVVRLVGKPLTLLCRLMEEGERGNLTVRTDFRSQDEIGRLGQSFNRMMQQIRTLVEQTNRSAQEVLRTAAELSEVSQNTALSAREIAAATGEIAHGAGSTAAAAEKGSLLTERIGLTTAEVALSNGRMGEASGRVQQVSVQGTACMNVLVEKTDENARLTHTIVDKVDRLKASASSMRQILDVLNNLTKQTNILSLNAAIEAARAGSAGKGFMVVAEEIRKLADQSRNSIQVVSGITETIRQEMEETVRFLLTANPMFEDQRNAVKEAAAIFGQVMEETTRYMEQLGASSASVEQLVESQHELSAAMGCVSSVVEETTASTEEVASLSASQLAISERIVGLSARLEDLSGQLKLSLVTFRT
ncbi:methyl-accepting chemotaxis protein [Paenibacillus sp. UNCCL117]|uniref:methyl-accepting chemotaxis protein n=1 Tax=unclassified Paenibacillus TaxID=185978 RepID=UPI00087FEF8A|nr:MULTISPECIES: methyl-accepting chemotaxis protein [unclassified Paenibacillus]SDD05466.1 methyl-accepting chemotaxis protein [Paenibacillus sp. cl123]SFW31886.1 methyl-accepting chemotaxis protein [Paenibacillus sp. UNCCL117]